MNDELKKRDEPLGNWRAPVPRFAPRVLVEAEDRAAWVTEERLDTLKEITKQAQDGLAVISQHASELVRADRGIAMGLTVFERDYIVYARNMIAFYAEREYMG